MWRPAALALVALGCSAAPIAPGPDAARDATPRDAMPRVEIGTGEVAFVEIPARGGTLELVHGPQGGYHVLLSVRVYDLVPERLMLVYEVVRPEGTVLSRTPFLLDAGRFEVEGDHLARYGEIVMFDIAMPSDVAGDEVIVRATATAADGASATDARTVTILDAL